jgi:hypothetical protein
MKIEIRYNVISCGPEFSYRKQIVDFCFEEQKAIKTAQKLEKDSAKRGFNFKYIVEKQEVITFI